MSWLVDAFTALGEALSFSISPPPSPRAERLFRRIERGQRSPWAEDSEAICRDWEAVLGPRDLWLEPSSQPPALPPPPKGRHLRLVK